MRREYGIDLLKIFSMVMVVMLHIMGRGGVRAACAAKGSSVYLAQQVLEAVSLCAVNCFVLATGYIMCQHTFRYGRIVKLWAEVVFYSLAIVLVACCWFPQVELTRLDWLAAVMPIGFEAYWFVTSYFGLFFLMPFLNRLLNALDSRERLILVVTGFALFSVLPTVFGRDLFRTHFGYSMVWFVFLYLAAGWVRIDRIATRLRPLTAFALAAAAVFVTLAGQVAGARLKNDLGLCGGFWMLYSSPGVVVESVCLLIGFSQMRIDNRLLTAVIGWASASVFSVYIIHSNGVFRRMVAWNDRFAGLSDYAWGSAVWGTLVCAVGIFTACAFIDSVRRVMLRWSKLIFANRKPGDGTR